jgi:xanthine dehydrogenase YagR molybdenum-binding subunit
MPQKEEKKQWEAREVIGKPTNRIDGPLKVTRSAMYSSDYNFPGMLYAVPLGATIANGKIESLDTSIAEKMPGVKAVYHRGNIGNLFRITPNKDMSAKADELRPPFEDDIIRYYGQYVAIAVAESLEQATAAAEAIKVRYSPKTPNVKSDLSDAKMQVEHKRGDAPAAFNSATNKVDVTYETPSYHHSAIELHATVAVYEKGNFTLYETTQAVVNHRNVMAQILGVEAENVKVISKFLGSGFGGKLWPWTHCALAAAAARNLERPVKLVITRKSVFHAAGHRPMIQQRIRVSANPDGKLTSLQHDFQNHTSMLDDYKENCGEATKYFYSCPNVQVTYGLAPRNVGTPTSMRGPGAVPGLWATESALDELAIKLNMDPVQLRILNEPKKDEGLDIPFASRHLVECYKLGAEKFGWKDRNPKVGSMKKNGLTLGWGTAGAGWLAERLPAQVTVEMRRDGSAKVLCATQDIGTGTYTILAQIAAEELQLPLNKVEVLLGDTTLPAGPISGGSMVTGSLIPAVTQACGKLLDSLMAAATGSPNSPFNGVEAKELTYSHGKLHRKSEPEGNGVPFEELMKKCNFNSLVGQGTSQGTFGAGKPKESRHSYGAHFIEVTWQEEIARLRVSRVVTVIDAGKILNPKAGRNQVEGSIAMGIGMALFEGARYDPELGAPLNSNLADYIVPVNLDVPALDVHFLEMPNTDLNSYGARGIGEIGMAGVASAIANAVYHATGKRIRKLPIRIEDLLA